MKIVNSTLAAMSSAQELKHRYQRNMLLSEAALVAVIAIGVLTAVLIAGPSRLADPSPLAPETLTVVILPLPPTIDPEEATTVAIKKEADLPEFSLPTAGPDEDIVEDYQLPSQEELATINTPAGLGDGDLDGKVIQTTPDFTDYIPHPDSFVAVEEQPQKVYSPAPVYPEIARKAGIEGSVWLKVLVGKDGNVREVAIFEDSRANAGFEEAAMAAAWESKWRPALQNKQPVALWVAYEVKFRLK